MGTQSHMFDGSEVKLYCCNSRSTKRASEIVDLRHSVWKGGELALLEG